MDVAVNAPPARIVEDADSPSKPGDYIFMNGLRLVKPYYFDFQCNIKQRMEGLSILQIVSEEFPTLSKAYYQTAWKAGNLRIADAPGWPMTRPLRTGQSIRHLVHRHEPPVLAGVVEVLGMTDDIVAVNKPSCLPVHTVGQYRKNTVLGVLAAERPDLGPLQPTNRLDKPVSGVLLLARSAQSANRICVQLQERTCEKVYVARVSGRFPDTPTALVVNAPIVYDRRVNMSYALDPGTADPERLSKARESITEVRLLSVAPDGLTSVVECRPKTGRTHQIRVHLLFLGHPVANDTQYGGTFGLPLFFRRLANATSKRAEADAGSVKGVGEEAALGATVKRVKHSQEGYVVQPEDQDHQCQHADRARMAAEAAAASSSRATAGSSGSSSAEGAAGRHAGSPVPSSSGLVASEAGGSAGLVIRDSTGQAAEAAQEQARSAVAEDQSAPGPSGHCILQDQVPHRFRHDPMEVMQRYRLPESSIEPWCPHCPYLIPQDYPIELEALWLHAQHYAGSGWSFEAPIPEWALPTYQASPAWRAGARVRKASPVTLLGVAEVGTEPEQNAAVRVALECVGTAESSGPAGAATWPINPPAPAASDETLAVLQAGAEPMERG